MKKLNNTCNPVKRNIISVHDFDFSRLELCGVVKSRKRGKIINCVNAFDIETTRFPEIDQSIMYIWQWHFDGIGTVVGRTWEEFLDFVKELSHTAAPAHIVTYVHNLAFEFSYLKGIYRFEPEDVFSAKPRKPITAKMYGVEFRCSRFLTNMSLDEYTHKMGVQHAKLGGFDYGKIRYPYTPLTDEELAYCIHDVQGLVEALKIDMATSGDTLASIPLTSTGYVRREAKKGMMIPNFQKAVKSAMQDPLVYQMELEAFRGGDTHANRLYTGYILKDVKSADRSSSYPDVEVNDRFPVSKFYKADVDTTGLFRLMEQGKALLMRVAFCNIRLTDKYFGAPYLARAKCRNVLGAVYDNGRILSADYLETTITDIDLEIILHDYTFDKLATLDCYFAKYGRLPRPLRELNKKLYRDKTELKNVPGQEVYYMKQKNKLNSIYGMTAERPIKDTAQYDPETGDYHIEKGMFEEQISHAWLNYAWGVWVTALARYRLREGIWLAGDNFVYCDTDSVKYLGDVDFSGYNAERVAHSQKNGAYATDPAGITHYMGVYEEEHPYGEFITWGAKKYAYTIDGKLGITVAGVGKKQGAEELQAAGGLKAFAPPFVFTAAGGLEAVYNDNITPVDYLAPDGRTYCITSNLTLRPSTYTLGLADDYLDLLSQRVALYGDLRTKVFENLLGG